MPVTGSVDECPDSFYRPDTLPGREIIKQLGRVTYQNSCLLLDMSFSYKTVRHMAKHTPKQIQQRIDTLLRTLPPFHEVLRGSLLKRSVRCGKPSCRCAEGPGHPVTYLSVTFAGGRTEQVTVPKNLVPLVRRWVSNYRRWLRVMERVSAMNRDLLRQRQLPADRAPPGKSKR